MFSYRKASSRVRPVKLKKLRYSSATMRLKSLLQTVVIKYKQVIRRERSSVSQTFSKWSQFGLLVSQCALAPLDWVADRVPETQKKKGGDSHSAAVRKRGNPLIPNSFSSAWAKQLTVTDWLRSGGMQICCNTALFTGKQRYCRENWIYMGHSLLAFIK